MQKMPLHESCVIGGSGKQRLPFLSKFVLSDESDIAIPREEYRNILGNIELGVFLER